MVNPLRRGASLLLAILSLAPAAALAGRDLPDYAVGEVAREDVVTPRQLVVIDAEETAQLKSKEASRVQVICRYYTNAADAAEAELRLTFNTTRSNFLEKVQQTFKRRKLDETAVNSGRFEQMVASFQRSNKLFPVSTNLAGIWAQSQPDRVLLSSLVASLREAMRLPMRPPNIDIEVKFGYQVRLVPLTDWDEPVNLETAERRGYTYSRTNVLTFTRARDNLLESFAPEDRATAKFLASLLKTNCIPDVELTRQARARRTDLLWTADRYEAGQTIVKQGQVVDRKIKAALEQLREKTALDRLQQKEIDEQVRARTEMERTREQARLQQLQNRRWVWGAVGSSLLFTLLAGWWLARRRRPQTLLPARMGAPDPSATPLVGFGPEPGTAGLPAALPPAEARAQAIPHLMRLLKDKLFQRLVSQQQDLMETQKRAAADMAEMEARLEKLHAPLQDRLQVYEQRIVELEKELARKGEENRALIQMKIQMVRQQMEATKTRLELN